MVIDFHTHIYPRYENQDSATMIQALRRSMADTGIRHSVILQLAAKIGQTKNNIEFARRTKDGENPSEGPPALLPFASVHPLDSDWRYWLYQMRQYGIMGIELHPNAQNFFVDAPNLEGFYKQAFKLGLILVINAGWDSSVPGDDHAAPHRIANILPVLQKGATVLVHLGGPERLGEACRLLCGKDIYLDTSFGGNGTGWELARKVIGKHTPERLLFGSDSPWCSQRTRFDALQRDFSEGFLSEADRDKILFGNAARLLRIDSGPQN